MTGCVIGGVQLTGGAGSIFGTALGAMLMQMLEQRLVLMGVPIQIFRAIVGLILMLSVVLNTSLTRIE